MHLLILATGRTRDAHMLALEQEYARRLPAPWRYEVRELKASTATDQPTAKREEAATQLAALQGLPAGTTLIALDERGQHLTSPGWAEKFAGWKVGGTRQVALLIGGATGLAPEVIAACHARWALSALTLPHQLVRVFLAEQLYRTYTLLSGHPYHRV